MSSELDKSIGQSSLTLKRLIYLIGITSFAFIAIVIIPGFFLELIAHTIAGWAIFLFRNLPRFSFDLGIFVSGCITALAGLITLHLFVRGFARDRWKWRQSIAIMLLLPIGFAASFLIPGVVLLFRSPLPEGLTTSSRHTERVSQIMNIRHLAQALQSHVNMHDLETYPQYPDPSMNEYLALGDPPFQDGILGSGFLYFLGGEPVKSDSPRLFVASPPFESKGETVRAVVFTDGKTQTLNLVDFEQLLDRSTSTHP